MHETWEPLAQGIGRMRVDPCCLENEIHIPAKLWDKFALANGGEIIGPGQSRPVELVVDGQSYGARLYYPDRAQPNRGDMEIRYDHNHELTNVLRTRFATSHDWIHQARIGKPMGMSVTVPDMLAEYIEFYPTGRPYRYRLELVTQHSNEDALTTGEHLADQDVLHKAYSPNLRE